MIQNSHTLGTALLEFTAETIAALVEHHFPNWRIPGTFAGHHVDADVRADLLYTLHHLEAGGIAHVAGDPTIDAITRLLTQVNGRNTHTFFSYRIAETLLAAGPFANNPLLQACSDDQRDQIARATDSRDWIELFDAHVLPRNYAAVLSRCEFARAALGFSDADPAVLDRLLDRLRVVLTANPLTYLDDSNDRCGRFDIYAADIWLFTLPLADRLGELWRPGAAAALDLVDRVAGPDGAAIPWGRSTGVLANALTIELAALATSTELMPDRDGAWMRRAADAFRGLRDRFDADGVIDAHRFRNQDAYRGPARRLQLTLDVLGKLAWAGTTLRAGPEVSVASAAITYPPMDGLVRFETDHATGVWVSRAPGRQFVVPFIGLTRSHYLPAVHAPGTYEVPVDADLPVWTPLIISRGRRLTAGERPDALTHAPGTVTARWDRLETSGRPLDGERGDSHAGTCTTTYRTEGRTITVAHTLSFERIPDAVTLAIPETSNRPLGVAFDADTPHATTSIEVTGIAEWSSPYSGIERVHQLDVDPAHRLTLRAVVTPHLRVASTAHGHWYDTSLYAPMANRVVGMAAPIGVLADGTTRLDDVELLHLHWPEWFGFDDRATHEALIATLADRSIPVVWTAHNLTPHDRRPQVYDPIYQRWAETADAVIHHSEYGRRRMLDRYQFRADCRHETIPHGHFGDLWPGATTMTKAEAGQHLGFTPAPIRIGLIGAPRQDKHVLAFLDGFAACDRTDIQVACWSLGFGDTTPEDPRIVAAEQYRNASPQTFATRLAACDLLAFPFDPDGDMLATGTVADAIGVGLPALVSDWEYLTETMGQGGIACGHTSAAITQSLNDLTVDHIDTARAALRDVRGDYEWGPIAAATADLFERVVLAQP